MSSQQAAPVPQKGFPNENQSAEKKPQSSAPPLTSVGALLNQACMFVSIMCMLCVMLPV